jgi:hypothetical protein
VITLLPRSWAMLCYLVEHAGCLVTKAELRQHVWMRTHVTDSVLRASVQEIRAALGDSAAAIAPTHWHAPGGGAWRSIGGDRGPTSRRLRARGGAGAGRGLLAADGGHGRPAPCVRRRHCWSPKGLTWLAALPEDPDWIQRELTLQLTLGELLRAVRGLMAVTCHSLLPPLSTVCPIAA